LAKEDDDDSEPADDDDDNNDNDDDDDNDDNDDDDSTIDVQIVYDDGEADSGIGADCAGCAIAQGFTPPSYPATLINVSYYLDGPYGLDNNLILNVYYATEKGQPDAEPVYSSDPLRVGEPDDWTTIYLSGVGELQGNPIVSGQFWIGFEYTVDLGIGPYIGWDYEGAPNDDMWHYDGIDAWCGFADYGYLGALMIRPTVSIPASGE